MKRFWRKADIRGPDECWTWSAYCRPDGYGVFKLRGKMERAHRVAWQLENGPIPAGMHVLHHCDNPPCCNPAHLFLGTQADNMADRDAKGRGRVRHGEEHPKAKLKVAYIPLIRELLRRGVSGVEVAQICGVHQSAIGYIRTGKNWRHIQ